MKKKFCLALCRNTLEDLYRAKKQSKKKNHTPVLLIKIFNENNNISVLIRSKQFSNQLEKMSSLFCCACVWQKPYYTGTNYSHNTINYVRQGIPYERF